jgi:hypothetical protein
MRDAGGSINHFEMRHNTAFNIGKNETVEVGESPSVFIQNNLFINSGFYGSSVNDDTPIYIIGVDSVGDGPQDVTINHNNVFLRSAITDAYPDSVVAPDLFNETAAAFVEEEGSIGTFTNIDAAFNNSPADPANIVTHFWITPDDEAPDFDTAGDGPAFDFGYPMSSPLYSAGHTGQPLGALFWFPGLTVSNEEENIGADIPGQFSLNGNFPNPFNPTTNISFDLAEAALVSVDIYNMLGQRVMTIPAQRMAAGANQILTVDATALSSGIYIYRVQAAFGSNVNIGTGKMTLIK